MNFGPRGGNVNDCPYDHEHGPCVDCNAVGPVGWMHTCFFCFEVRMREGMYGRAEAE